MAEIGTAPMEIVAHGETIVKLENETQMSIAVQRPRDEAKILAASLHELDLYPSMADQAIYTKPVGKDDTGKMKYASSLSIRAGESLANRWGNNSRGTEIIEETEDFAKVAAVFLDYETNVRSVTVRRVSKFYKNRQGQIVRIAPDRFDTIVLANGSKALREVILRGLPSGLRKEYETKARMILKKEPLDKQRQAVIERFAHIGVSLPELEAWQQKQNSEWTKDDVMDALGLVNAIRDGESTIEETFGAKETPKKEENGKKPNLKPRETP